MLPGLTTIWIGMAQASRFHLPQLTGTAVRARAPGADPGGALPLLWRVFVLSWPVFVVAAGPAVEAFGGHASVPGLVAALAWTIAFLACYLWLCLNQPFRTDVPPTVGRARIVLLALLAGLVLILDLAHTQGNFWVFICVLVPAGIVLSPRAAVWTMIAITALAAGIEGARWGWTGAPQVLGISIWGVAAILLRQLVLAVNELTVAREERARLAVVEERMRFARDLHDLLGHSLSLIALKSQLAGRLLRAPDGQAAAEIADIEDVSRRALREVREAVAGYRTPNLAEEIASSREILRAAGITCIVDASVGPLPPAVDAVFAWTVREGVTNVIRHGEARHCAIEVSQGTGTARVRVINDGPGSAESGEQAVPGCGLRGIAERAAANGGGMRTGPRAGGGFTLQVTIPLDIGAGAAPAPRTREQVAG